MHLHDRDIDDPVDVDDDAYDEDDDDEKEESYAK